MKHLVLGTAGHVDHGKTSLIQALTGTDADRLREEKRRGLTIDIGFAQMRFEETLLDIVDLPGHSDFLGNMLAGAADVDMVLLTVSSDDGVMEQTREHLRILSLLDVSRWIVVLTKTDLVDTDMLELAREEIKELYGAWGIPVCTPIVAVSAKTGQGMDRLRQVIIEQCALMPARRSDRPFYMHVDRSFTVKGSGTVVTGTVREGAVRAGEEILMCPEGGIVRVRGIQSGGQPIEEAVAGQRASLNLAGVSKEQIRRGQALSALLPVHPAKVMDARIVVLPESKREIVHGMRMHVYVGTASAVCRVRLPRGGRLGPGESGYGQLELETPVAALSGERFVLRFFSPLELVGGGTILDACSVVHKQKAWQKAAARMSCYEYGGLDGRFHWEASEALCTEQMLRERFSRWSEGEFRRTRDSLLERGLLIRAGDLLLGSQLAGALKGELIEQLTQCHKEHPLADGMPLEEARRICPGGLLELCFRDGTVRREGLCVALPLFDPRKTRRYCEMASILLELSHENGPMDRDALIRLSGLERPEALLMLKHLEADGAITLLKDGMLVETFWFEQASGRLCRVMEQEALTLARARDLLGISRKFTQTFLECLDAKGVTVREGDARHLAVHVP